MSDKVGRPTKYKNEYAKQAYKLCLLNATDKEIADFFSVSESTLNLWKTKHEEFSESIKEGKEKADIDIVNSLYHRAKGMVVKSKKAVKVRVGKGQDDIRVVEEETEVPPDVTAIKYWLNNRRKNWTDKHTVVTEDEDGNQKPLEIKVTGLG